jgi:hypothetical protein
MDRQHRGRSWKRKLEMHGKSSPSLAVNVLWGRDVLQKIWLGGTILCASLCHALLVCSMTKREMKPDDVSALSFEDRAATNRSQNSSWEKHDQVSGRCLFCLDYLRLSFWFYLLSWVFVTKNVCLSVSLCRYVATHGKPNALSSNLISGSLTDLCGRNPVPIKIGHQHNGHLHDNPRISASSSYPLYMRTGAKNVSGKSYSEMKRFFYVQYDFWELQLWR